MTKKRILLIAEAVTLAHVARPIVLARRLAAMGHDTVLACDDRFARFLTPDVGATVPLACIGSARFLAALAAGRPVYDIGDLQQYVRDDLALIRQVQPDLIIGDFRLSLSASARLAGVPYAAITNAYWSPLAHAAGYPLPVLPMTRFLPIPLARLLFRAARPFAFPLHCAPLNRLRKENGLPPLGNDLRRVYTDADVLLYADDPALYAFGPLPPNHHWLGPLPWSPAMPVPAAWDSLDRHRPTVYLTLGSSGDPARAAQIYKAVDTLQINLIVAAAGSSLPAPSHPGTLVADYVPGDAAAARSQLVICNGGSPTTQQALAAGVPVLGIAGNMDQYLNMQAVNASGAGRLVRADRIEQRAIQSLVREMLGNSSMRQKAHQIGERMARQDLDRSLRDVLGSIER